MKLTKHENFDHKKTKYLDDFAYSWNIHGYNTLAKFLPITTKVISEQMNFSLNMTNR